VFFGSMLLEGTLTGIVFQTAKQTVMSKIADLTQNTAKDLSTMEREINYFSMVISFLAITTGIFAYFLWFFLVKFYHPDYL
jgi:sodium/potassium-transporting ATPase subunit alpha